MNKCSPCFVDKSIPNIWQSVIRKTVKSSSFSIAHTVNNEGRGILLTKKSLCSDTFYFSVTLVLTIHAHTWVSVSFVDSVKILKGMVIRNQECQIKKCFIESVHGY